MIQELHIDSFGSFIDLATKINVEQHYRMWYRGQSDDSWGLVPSVHRERLGSDHREQYLTTNFMIQTMRFKQNAPQQYDRSAWLTLMQHYYINSMLLGFMRVPSILIWSILQRNRLITLFAKIACCTGESISSALMKMGVEKGSNMKRLFWIACS